MKTIRLLSNFYKEHWLPLLLLLMITLFSTSLLINVLSEISYSAYIKELFSSSPIRNSVYYMPGVFEDSTEGLRKIRTDLESLKLPAVRDIIQPVGGVGVGYEEKTSNVYLCDPAYREAFPYVDDGRWLSREDGESPEVEAVVSGYLFRKVSVGDEIVVTTNEYAQPPITKKVKVIGKKEEPSYFPSFNYAAQSVTAQNIFAQGHNTFSICKEDGDALLQDAGPDAISGYGVPSENLLIRLKENASEKEREETIARLSETGSVVTYEEILAATDEAVLRERREKLPRPFLMLFISTFSMIAIAVLIIDKRLAEYRVYFLCGCSKRKGFAQMLGAVSLIPILAGFLNLLYLAWVPNLYATANPLNPFQGAEEFVFGPEVSLAVIAYAVISFVASAIIPFLNIRKESAIQVYRR